jgi:hypothetical protein
MRLANLASALLLAWSGTALANGGGYSFGVTFTGSVAPFQASGTEKVRIVDEKLDIALGRSKAVVAVRYEMQNVTDQPVTVRFGFPVEAVPRPAGEEFEVPVELTPAQRRERLVESLQQLHGYAVTLDGARLKAELIAEPFATGKSQPFPGAEALKGVGGWMVSDAVFPPAKQVRLEIRYAADYSGSVQWVSDDTRESSRGFAYRLSTGAVWSGPIGTGEVTVRADGIAADEVEIAAPRERFRRDGDRWVWAFKDLEPTLADDIRIDAIPGMAQLLSYRPEDRGARYFTRAGVWAVLGQDFKARASSTLPSSKTRGYGAENLASNQLGAWCEGVPGSGAGQWVEILPTKASPLMAFSLEPGFVTEKGSALYQANGRPSRVEVLLNGEHRFVAALDDAPDFQLIPIVGYAKPVSRLRITMLEVTAGTRYQDTCISKVKLYERLAKAPGVHGAR